MVEASTFVANVGAGYGGAIYASYSSLTCRGNTMANHTVSVAGGAIYQDRVSLTLDGDTFANNGAGTDGGAIYVFASGNSLAARDVHCDGNTAAGRGGAFYLGTGATVTESEFSRNSAADGGAIYIDQAGTTLSGDSVTGARNSFLGNQAARGRAIFNNVPFDPNGGGDVGADFVCWARSNPNADPLRIWDFFDDATLGIVIPTNPVVCDPIVDFGGATPATSGFAALSASGSLLPGSLLRIDLTGAVPNGMVELRLGGMQPYEFLPAYRALVFPGTLGAPRVLLPTDGTGAFSLPVALAAGLPVGFDLVLQAGFPDGGAPYGGVALSNAVLARRP